MTYDPLAAYADIDPVGVLQRAIPADGRRHAGEGHLYVRSMTPSLVVADVVGDDDAAYEVERVGTEAQRVRSLTTLRVDYRCKMWHREAGEWRPCPLRLLMHWCSHIVALATVLGDAEGPWAAERYNDPSHLVKLPEIAVPEQRDGEFHVVLVDGLDLGMRLVSAGRLLLIERSAQRITARVMDEDGSVVDVAADASGYRCTCAMYLGEGEECLHSGALRMILGTGRGPWADFFTRMSANTPQPPTGDRP